MSADPVNSSDGKPRGACPVCGRELPLSANGVLPAHGESRRCTGSWQQPKEDPVNSSDRSKTMAEVVESLSQTYDDAGVAIVLARGKVIGGKYGTKPPIEVCETPEGRYDVWAMGEAMADGVFV